MESIRIKRIIALVIDLTIIGLLVMILENLLPDWLPEYKMNIGNWDFQLRINMSYLMYLPYFLTFDLFSNGISIGKHIMGLIISPVNGTYLNIQTRFLRTLLKVISISFLPITALIYVICNGYNLEDAVMHTKVEMRK